jgi:hypothetical protein
MSIEETKDRVKADLDIWFDDYISHAEFHGEQSESNEWYLQLKSVFDAAYGAGNW